VLANKACKVARAAIPASDSAKGTFLVEVDIIASLWGL
jgi:hypothetical protein